MGAERGLVIGVLGKLRASGEEGAHQEDHTFLFWLYKAVIRSKKTKS